VPASITWLSHFGQN